MIQMQSQLDVADNSGAKTLMCIKVMAPHRSANNTAISLVALSIANKIFLLKNSNLTLILRLIKFLKKGL